MDEISTILQGGNLHGSPSFLLKNCINSTVGNVTFGPVSVCQRKRKCVEFHTKGVKLDAPGRVGGTPVIKYQ